jgi:exodeoxyribonuclease VII small subunit
MLPTMDEGKTAAAKADNISQMSFEQALAALEDIVKQLERGDVPLDQSITLYERGEKLRAACQSRLDAAQARIERIVTSADGAAIATQPFDPEA